MDNNNANTNGTATNIDQHQNETINAKHISVPSGAASHPLQDIELNSGADDDDADFDDVINKIPEMQQQNVNSSARNKENWVKFDDDVNEANERNNNENNKSNEFSAAIDSSGSSSSNNATAVAEAAPNRLSPLPPPAGKSKSSQHTTTRPRTPTESQQQQTLAIAAPVQRSTVSSTSTMPDVAPAVLNTESTHVNLNASGRPQHQHQQQQQQHQKLKTVNASSQQHTHTHHSPINGTGGGVGTTSHPSGASKPMSVAVPIESVPPMRTIELSTGRIREGFGNGDVIVTLLPANTKWPWVTPAIFRPELVPEELMAQGLTLTVEEYVNAMETLVNDYRFTVYNICYKRILVCWIFFAFAVLLTLLFSGLQGVALFSLGVGWLFLNAAAIFLCMWIKLRLSRGLEKCLARVNKQLMKHKILLVLDDRGRISCHKVNLCFLYFDPAPCVNFLNEFLEQAEQNGGEAIKAGWESKLDIDLNDIVIQGNQPVRLSRKQAVAQELFLSYLQRWGKDFLRRRLDWTVQEAGVHEQPRHLQSSICPCQYEEEVLRNKIKLHSERKKCCGITCNGCWL